MSKSEVNLSLVIHNKGLKEALNEVTRDLGKVTDGWMSDIKKDLSATVAGAIRTTAGSVQTTKAWESMILNPIKKLESELTDAFKKGDLVLTQQLHSQLKDRRAALDRELDERKKAEEEILRRRRRDTVEQIDDLKEGLEGIGSSLFDPKSLADGIFKGIRSASSRLQQAGKHKQAQASEMALSQGPNAQAAKMEGMGKMLAQAGKAFSVFAAVGASVIMMIKLFIDLENKIKDMNKALMASAGASDFGMSATEIQLGGVTKSLEKMRDETTAVNSNFLKFRVGAEEQQRALAAFNQSGYTYARMNKDLAEGRDLMKSYSDATAVAAVYGRNLGASTEEVAQAMGTVAFETGDHLRTVAEQFSMIQKESMSAGFSTKRFYSTILEVTSGMAFYGVRIEETAKMLKNFDSLLGEAVGSDLYKQIVGKGKDMGAQDRIKEILLKDPQFVAEQYGKAFDRELGRLTRSFGQPGGPLAGLDISKLLNLDEVSLQQELQKAGLTPEQITQFVNTRLLKRAEGGDMAAMTRARGFAGPGFDIAMASQATGAFGDNKRIDEIFSAIERGEMGAEGFAALETATGKSQDELEKLARTFSAADSRLKNLTEIRDKIAAGQMLTEQDIRVQEEARDKLGLYLDKQTGKILRGEFDSDKRLIEGTGVAVEDALDVVTAQSMSAGEEAIKKQLTKDQEIATEISRNVTGLQDILNQSINAILNDIYDVLSEFFRSWLTDSGMESQKLTSIEEARKTRLQLEGKVKSMEQDRKGLSQRLADAESRGDTDEIKKLQKEKADLELRIAKATEQQIKFTDIEEKMKTQDATGKGGELALSSAKESGLIDVVSAKSTQQAIDQLLGADDLEDLGLKAGLMWGDSLTDHIMERFDKMDEESKAQFLKSFGGEEGLKTAIESANRAAKAEKGNFGVKDAFMPSDYRERAGGAAKGAFEQSLLRSAMEAELGRPMSSVEGALMAADSLPSFLQTSVTPVLENIDRNLSTSKDADNPFSNAIRVQDMILPAGGGAPIITDPKDTLMAMKPGGPISGSLGKNMNIEIHINGGESREIAQQVLKILGQLDG